MELNRHFSKEDIWMFDNHRERYLISIAIKEIQISTTVSDHFPPPSCNKHKTH